MKSFSGKHSLPPFNRRPDYDRFEALCFLILNHGAWFRSLNERQKAKWLTFEMTCNYRGSINCFLHKTRPRDLRITRLAFRASKMARDVLDY